MKFSHSAIKIYSECGKKYQLWYKKRLRSKYTSGALIAGSALDRALNVLLLEKDLTKAKAEFLKSMLNTPINGTEVYVPTSTLVTYSKADFDADLLKSEDEEKFALVMKEKKYQDSRLCGEVVSELIEKKTAVGLKGMSETEQCLLSLGNYLSMCQKGLIILDSYYEKVIPKIKEVHCVQKSISLENNDGDIVIGFIDLVATLDDGKTYTLDNKTTSSMQYYPEDAPMRSQQLIVYDHAIQNEVKTNGVGFIVMEKNIRKNKTKICKNCKNDGTGKRHKTCDVVKDGERCNGEWKETIDPEAYIQFILNEVPAAATDLVIEAFDKSAEGIKMENFAPNLSACRKGPILCEFYNHCWNGDDKDLVEMPQKEEKK